MMRAVKAFLLVVSCAGTPACQRAQAPADVKTVGQLHQFTPAVFHNTFDATHVPVLRLSSGDSIHLTTIDAAGTDEKGVRRAAAGNPLTGPFHIEGVEPGDAVAIQLTRLRLNRDCALSTDTLSHRAITPALAARMNSRGQLVRWRLDLLRGIAMREDPSANLARYTVPLTPMLGCIGLAPAAAGPPPHSGQFGVWGGNLDFNGIVEGATVFLPVRFREGSCTSATPTPRRATAS